MFYNLVNLELGEKKPEKFEWVKLVFMGVKYILFEATFKELEGTKKTSRLNRVKNETMLQTKRCGSATETA